MKTSDLFDGKDANRLRQLLDFDPSTGTFRWINRRGSMPAHSIAGSKHKDGYLQISVDGRRFLSHRLAWLYVHGVAPSMDIDHINGDRSDNRISNLRLATRSENSQNRPLSQRNRSGFPGVTWQKDRQKWAAGIKDKGIRYHLGLFDSPKDAFEAYADMKRVLHPKNPMVRNFSIKETLP